MLLPDHLFIGTFSTGLFYSDKRRTVHGDYARCGAIYFHNLRIVIENDCPTDLRATIIEHAESIKQRVGQEYRISSSDQTVTLGYAL